VSFRAIVVGGTGTVGRALCRGLSGRGAQLGFTFHRAEEAARAQAFELSAHAARADLALAGGAGSIEPALDDLLARLGGLDALCVAAAIGTTDAAAPAAASSTSSGATGPRPTATVEEIDAAAWDALLAVNLRGAYLACRRAARAMRGAGGNLVLLGAIDGLRLVPAPAHYAASKAGLAGMVRALAKELGPDGIRVNLVAPGLLDGGLSRTIPDDLRREYLKHCAQGRPGRPEEAAALCAFLMRDNTYLTGQTLVLDGSL
jgi:NAD(P)-dependent dehydrogenase (short-subunit alcohol dehydrogenase family)